MSSRPLRLLFPLALAALVCGPARAQDPDPEIDRVAQTLRVGTAIVPQDRVFHTPPADGAQWSRGARYKVRFGADGVAYHPFFGADAPRHYPVVLGPARVEVDGVALDVPERVEPQRSGDVVTYARGALVERFAMAPDSIEQTFQLSSLPARGEITVHVPVATELARRNLPDGSCSFWNELGTVHYSRAVAFDAVGRTLALETVLGESGVDITVPSGFVLDAVLPITIDPIVTTIDVDSSTTDTFAADACFDATTGRFTVIYLVRVTGTDRDVFLRNYTIGGGIVIGTDAFVDTSADDWSSLSIANQNETETNIIVANVLVVGTGGGHFVKAMTYDVVLGLLNGPFAITGTPTPVGPMHPRIGGDPTTGAGTRLFCVVWDRREAGGTDLNRNVFARCLLPSGALFGTSNINLAVVTGQDDGDPSISRTNDGTSWIVAWERIVSPTDGDILAARIDFDGTLEQAAYPIEVNSVNQVNPEVSSRITGSNRYVVVMERTFPDGSKDVFASLMNNQTREDGTTINFGDGTPDFGQGSPTDTDPQVSCDGRHFAITYLEAASVGSTNTNVFVTDWMQTETELRLAESRQSLATSPTAEKRPRMVAVHTGGSATSRRHLILWDDDDDNIEAAIYDSEEGGAVTAYCFGDGSGTSCPCGNVGALNRGCPNSVDPLGARLDVLGTVSTVADDAHLRGQFMPGGSTCLYFQGTATVSSSAPPFGDGAVFGDGLRCVGGSIIRLAQVTNSGTGLSIFPPAGSPVDLHVLGGVPAAGGRRIYQGWYRNAANFCTSSTFNLTNGVIIDWGP